MKIKKEKDKVRFKPRLPHMPTKAVEDKRKKKKPKHKKNDHD